MLLLLREKFRKIYIPLFQLYLIMLTEKIRELEGRYNELYARERGLTEQEPVSLQGRRRRFIDYLFDEVLSREDIFEKFGVIGSTEHKDNGIVVKYMAEPGHPSFHDESGVVSHYQFMIFRQGTSFGWFPDFLVLRDRDTSDVKVYEIGYNFSSQEIGKIGSSEDLNLSYEMKYTSPGKGLVVERGGVHVKEVSRDELCDPDSIPGFEKTFTPQGRMFDSFYRGFQHFADACLKKINQLKGGVYGEEIDKSYETLRAIAERE